MVRGRNVGTSPYLVMKHVHFNNTLLLLFIGILTVSPLTSIYRKPEQADAKNKDKENMQSDKWPG